MMKRKYQLTSLVTLSGILLAFKAQAVCPVCVVAVTAGLGLSEYLGIDDTIAGVWIGGLLVATIIWTIDWFNKKNYTFGNKDLRDIATVILYYVLIFWPLAAKGIVGSPLNKFWGIDKLILGTVVGTVVFLALTFWYKNIKAKNNGHAQFPFQKVVMPVGGLLIFSFIFYFLTK